MKTSEIRKALFEKIIAFDEEKLSALLFAANCIQGGIETYNRQVLENNRLRESLKMAQGMMKCHKKIKA